MSFKDKKKRRIFFMINKKIKNNYMFQKFFYKFFFSIGVNMKKKNFGLYKGIQAAKGGRL